ncbi:hypothetical protein ACROYT_G040614 [Oculina patagonica]
MFDGICFERRQIRKQGYDILELTYFSLRKGNSRKLRQTPKEKQQQLVVRNGFYPNPWYFGLSVVAFRSWQLRGVSNMQDLRCSNPLRKR